MNIVAIGLLLGAAAVLLAPTGIRGFWVDAFNPGIKSKAEVDALVGRLQRARCNAVFVQVRKRGDAYYHSRYEPRALDNRDGWDPLPYLIERAHAASPRITVHAWINAAAVGSPSVDPGHVLAKHPSWRSVSDTGEGDDKEAVKIDPGVPEAVEWTYRVYLDVLRSYPVDGIHFDFIRYGGARWGYAPASVARFNARHGRQGQPAWDDPLWQQWRRDQVTSLVRKVYTNAVAVRPGVIVSAALISWGDGPRAEEDWAKSSAYSAVYQDWNAWLQEGILDLACPMTYFRAERHRTFQENWAEWIKEHQFGRAATVAVGTWLNPIADNLEMIRINQAPSKSGKSAAGTLLYSYRGTNAIPGPAGGPPGTDAYNEAAYDAYGQALGEPVPFPELPWKAKPTRGHVKGSVLAGTGLAWADGAEVRIEGNGVQRTQTAGGTGFYAFADLAPGAYTVTAAYQGETSAPRPVEVAAGKVASADFLMASGDLPPARPVRGIGREKHGARVLLEDRTVTVGTGTLGGGRFFLADRFGGPAVAVQAPANLILPLVPGDLVTLTATTRFENGQKLLVADAVQVVGAVPVK